jgi:hypothetical protein
MEIEQRLERILSHVNRWLEFAEKKNGALLAGNSALILGVVSRLQNASNIPPFAKFYVYFALLLVGAAATCCLISFLPQTQMPGLASRREANGDDNLLLFSDLADYSPADVLSALCQCTGESGAELNRLHTHYAEQIITNSRIAERKYDFFWVALWLTLAALVTPLVAAIIGLAIARHRS